MSHVEDLRARLQAYANRDLSPFWTKKKVAMVGGLFAVGFGSGLDLILVVSHDGRGIFNSLIGELIARDEKPPAKSWFSEVPYQAIGIGPLEGQSIPLAGIHGRGLLRFTRSGWSLDVICLDWPDNVVFLQPPMKDILIENQSQGCVRIDEPEEIRAVGFSETGQSFIIATSSDITFYARV